MARCSAIKANGARCQKPADGQHGFCWSHHPANAAARSRTASKGGRGKANREVRDLKSYLRESRPGREQRGDRSEGRGGDQPDRQTRLSALEVDRAILGDRRARSRDRGTKA